MISRIKTHTWIERNTDRAILDCSVADQILTTEAFLGQFLLQTRQRFWNIEFPYLKVSLSSSVRRSLCVMSRMTRLLSPQFYLMELCQQGHQIVHSDHCIQQDDQALNSFSFL